MFASPKPFPHNWQSINTDIDVYLNGIGFIEARYQTKKEELIRKLDSDDVGVMRDALTWLQFVRIELTITAAAYFEACVNLLGTKVLSESVYKKTIERCSFWEKVRMLHVLYKKELPGTDSHRLPKVRWIIDNRNDVVHPKATESRSCMTAIHEQIPMTDQHIKRVGEGVEAFRDYMKTLWPEMVL